MLFSTEKNNRVAHVLKRIFEVGPLDLLLGLWVRRSVSNAGIILVTPGLPLPKIINRGGNVEINYARLYPGVRIECWKSAIVTIGRGTYLNRNTEVVASGSVRIGDNCMIARDVIIMDTDQHAIGNTAMQIKPVVIEDRVWIASRVIILKGVTIGHDSIIGAGSVVTKSVPPYSVVVGPAAHIIKNLQTDTTGIELLGQKILER